MSNRTGVTVEVDPISRIEGHLGVKVTTDGSGIVSDASAHGNMWRGFENFLLGREANDAITFTQRICGVCPVPHGMTSTYAIDTVLGYSAGHITFAYDGTNGVPAKAVSIRNLVLGSEFLMSNITHFYHLAAPSYVQGPNMPPWTPYFDDAHYSPALVSTGHGVQVGGRGVAPLIDGTMGFSADVWSTVIRSYVVALRIRRLTFEAGALFAGRMPMTSTYCAGGVTFDGTEDLTSRVTMFEDIMKEVGLFIIKEYVPIVLALGVLYPNYDNASNVTDSPAYGAGLGRFLAWGAFPASDVTDSTAPLGVWGGLLDVNDGTDNFQAKTKGDVASKLLAGGTNSVPSNLVEDIENSRYQVYAGDSAVYGTGSNPATAAYPGDVSRTQPKRSNGYSYMKAPRWNGKACEVGPMARCYVNEWFVNGTALATSLGGAYTAYVKTANSTMGLDPAMIEADIAVALLNAGLATLTIDDGGTPTEITTVSGLSHAAIVAAYTDANAVITGDIAAWVIGLTAGLSTMDRLRGRGIESLVLVQQMIGAYDKATGMFACENPGDTTSWTGKLKHQTGGANDTDGSTWRTKSIPAGTVQGWGGTEAPRGALMHQVTIKAGKITKYQCIVPTTWNGSPTTGSGATLQKGAIEAAVIGTPLADITTTFEGQSGNVTTKAGVEVLRVAQSFDPCLACAIH